MSTAGAALNGVLKMRTGFAVACVSVVALMFVPDAGLTQQASGPLATTAKPIEPLVLPIRRVQPPTPKIDPRLKAGAKTTPSRAVATKPAATAKAAPAGSAVPATKPARAIASKNATSDTKPSAASSLPSKASVATKKTASPTATAPAAAGPTPVVKTQ